MARLSIAAWLSRLAAGEVLRAYRVHRVAYGDAYLVRRRYLGDGTIYELTGTGPDADDGTERSAGRWTDLEAERQRLKSAGWDVGSESRSR